MKSAPALSATPTRLHSLDALRGFDMFCLLIADGVIRALAKKFPDSGVAQFFRAQFTHPDWAGFTFYDLIFPLFEFMIGVSVWLSVTKRLARGDSRGTVLRHAAWRVAAMVLLGWCVNGNLLTWDPAQFRLDYSVLQMLAVAYLGATLFVTLASLRGQLIGFTALLIGYWALQTFIPLPAESRTYQSWMGQPIAAPAHQIGVYSEGSVFSFWLDQFILGSWNKWEVGWILESMTHCCSALLGVFAARLLSADFREAKKVQRLLVMGLMSLAVGWLWSFQFPIIKNLWTSTFVLWAGGWSFLLLAFFYALIDGCGWSKWAFPFVVIGSNSMLAYLMATFLRPVPAVFANVWLGHLKALTGEWHPVILAAGTGLTAWLVLFTFYRRKFFFRL